MAERVSGIRLELDDRLRDEQDPATLTVQAPAEVDVGCHSILGATQAGRIPIDRRQRGDVEERTHPRCGEDIRTVVVLTLIHLSDAGLLHPPTRLRERITDRDQRWRDAPGAHLGGDDGSSAGGPRGGEQGRERRTVGAAVIGEEPGVADAAGQLGKRRRECSLGRELIGEPDDADRLGGGAERACGEHGAQLVGVLPRDDDEVAGDQLGTGERVQQVSELTRAGSAEHCRDIGLERGGLRRL